jgi:hypothetical protein
MNFEDIKLSEINQKQKEKYYLTPFMWGTYLIKSTEQKVEEW